MCEIKALYCPEIMWYNYVLYGELKFVVESECQLMTHLAIWLMNLHET